MKYRDRVKLRKTCLLGLLMCAFISRWRMIPAFIPRRVMKPASGGWHNATNSSSNMYYDLVKSFRPAHPTFGVGPKGLDTLPRKVQDEFVTFNMSWLMIGKTGRYGISRGQVPKQAQPFMKYSGRVKGWSHNWTQDLVETMIKAAAKGEDIGCQDYPGSAFQIRAALDRVLPLVANGNATNPLNVLIAGSISPWVEALVLGTKGLMLFKNRVVTTDYMPLDIRHPAIEFAHMDDLKSSRPSPAFDIVLSYSSIEHDGLGRYGDPINPKGDFAAMAEYNSMLKDGGFLIFAVPTVPLDGMVGTIQANWHRIYSFSRLERMWCGFDVIGERIDPPTMRLVNGKRPLKSIWVYQPVFILKKTRSHSCYSELLP